MFKFERAQRCSNRHIITAEHFRPASNLSCQIFKLSLWHVTHCNFSRLKCKWAENDPPNLTRYCNNSPLSFSSFPLAQYSNFQNAALYNPHHPFMVRLRPTDAACIELQRYRLVSASHAELISYLHSFDSQLQFVELQSRQRCYGLFR